MTVAPTLGPQGAPYQLAESKVSAMPGADDYRSFADTLLEMLGQELAATDDDPRSFGGGTMRPTVEMFDARGFFDADSGSDGPTASAGNLAAPAATATMSAVAPDPAKASMSPETYDATIDAPCPVSFTGGMPNVGERPARVTMSTEGPVVRGGPPQAGGLPSIAPASAPARGSRSAGIVPMASEATRTAAVRRPAGATASNLKVALDVGVGGVAVSVIGDPVDPGERGELHRAVAQLLARHGLVLSELRIARRPWADGQQQGSR